MRFSQVFSSINYLTVQTTFKNTFEVGVWVPVVVESVNNENIPPSSVAPGDSFDTIGLMSSSVRAGGDLSDDEDADAVIMFDFSKYLAEKAVSTNKQSIPTQNIGSTLLEPTKLYLDKMEMLEDRERTVKEEIVDLMQFDDDEEEDCKTAVNYDSEDESIQMEKGERQKFERDHAMATNDELTQGQILAPELPKDQNRFSFASPSSSSNCILSNAELTLDCLEGSLIDDKAYGVSPRLLLTALTTSNASDGKSMNSFLCLSVPPYLLLHIYVSNCNLYRLGKRLGIPSLIVASKFDVYDSWLPPWFVFFFFVLRTLKNHLSLFCLVADFDGFSYMPNNNFKAPNSEDAEERDKFIEDVLDGNETVQKLPKPVTGWDQADMNNDVRQLENGVETINFAKQYISDKSIADAVEALIGAHLLTLGPQPTLKVIFSYSHRLN
uniref:RNase III domain-containing protein n=1 Tax=Angiostrongylus cantonensis TaxID=6313 RepID=A0A0K0CWP4_ANGCA